MIEILAWPECQVSIQNLRGPWETQLIPVYFSIITLGHPYYPFAILSPFSPFLPQHHSYHPLTLTLVTINLSPSPSRPQPSFWGYWAFFGKRKRDWAILFSKFWTNFPSPLIPFVWISRRFNHPQAILHKAVGVQKTPKIIARHKANICETKFFQYHKVWFEFSF
jgi:hypothetical protein